jgi:flagellar protein FlbD
MPMQEGQATEGLGALPHKDGASMITLTRLSGAPFALNPDLVERVDCTPDTVLTLVDGTKYIVAEDLDTVVEEILEYRARILATADVIERGELASRRRSRLAAVPDEPVAELEPAHAEPEQRSI